MKKFNFKIKYQLLAGLAAFLMTFGDFVATRGCGGFLYEPTKPKILEERE